MYKYYVYGHYTDDGELFYIGKGTGDRINILSRNTAHDRISARRGCNPKILLSYLTEKEALAIEETLIWNAEEVGFILTNQLLGNTDKPYLSDEESIKLIELILNRKQVNTNFNSQNKDYKIMQFIEGDVEEIEQQYEKTIYNLIEYCTPVQMDILSIALLKFIIYSENKNIQISFDELSSIIEIKKDTIYKELIGFFPNLDLIIKKHGVYKKVSVLKQIECRSDCWGLFFDNYYHDLMVYLYNNLSKHSTSKTMEYLTYHGNLYNSYTLYD